MTVKEMALVDVRQIYPALTFSVRAGLLEAINANWDSSRGVHGDVGGAVEGWFPAGARRLQSLSDADADEYLRILAGATTLGLTLEKNGLDQAVEVDPNVDMEPAPPLTPEDFYKMVENIAGP